MADAELKAIIQAEIGDYLSKMDAAAEATAAATGQVSDSALMATIAVGPVQ